MEKKKMRIWKKVLLVVIVLLLIGVVITFAKYNVFSKLEKVAKETQNSNNYSMELHSLQDNDITITKAYYKDGKFLTTLQFYSKESEGIRKVTSYYDGNEPVAIIEAGGTKTAIVNSENVVGLRPQINSYAMYETGFWTKIAMTLDTRISEEKTNGIDCYLLETSGGWKRWFAKDTGLLVREINGGFVTDYHYGFNTVTDNDIAKPDISDCNIQQNS